MKVWYIIKGNEIESCIEEENVYYVLEDIWVFKGRINKRPTIKRVLKDPHVIVYRTSHIPYDPPIHFVLVNYPALKEALIRFKRKIKKIGDDMIEELENL